MWKRLCKIVDVVMCLRLVSLLLLMKTGTMEIITVFQCHCYIINAREFSVCVPPKVMDICIGKPRGIILI